MRIAVCLLFGFAMVVTGYYHDGPARYKFEYAVHDPHTNDIKNQWESRDGGRVRGSYSLVEPDGTRRVVDYTADGHNGFNAVVRRQGHAYHGHPTVSYHGHGMGGGYYRKCAKGRWYYGLVY